MKINDGCMGVVYVCVYVYGMEYHNIIMGVLASIIRFCETALILGSGEINLCDVRLIGHVCQKLHYPSIRYSYTWTICISRMTLLLLHNA